MAKVNVLITVDRASAIIAGKGEWGAKLVSIDLDALSKEERAEVAAAQERPERAGHAMDLTGNVGAASSEDIAGANAYPKLVEATVEGTYEVIRARMRQRASAAKREAEATAKRAAEWERRQDEWMAQTDEALLQRAAYASDPPRVTPGWGGMTYRPEVVERMDRLRAVWQAAKDGLKAVQLEANRRAAEAERVREAAKAERFEKWVGEHCTPEQQRRQARGLLPESEALDAVRDALFAPLNAFPRYQRVTRAELDAAYAAEHGYEPYGKIEFTTEEPDEATAEEFASFEAVARVAAETMGDKANCEFRDHVGRADGEFAIGRKSVMVTIEQDGWKLSREYACP